MDCVSLTELCRHFDDRLTSVTRGVKLQAGVRRPECQQRLRDLNSELQHVLQVVNMMKLELAKQKQQLHTVQEVKAEFSSLLQHLDYTLNNVPQRLPNAQENGSGPVKTCSNADPSTDRSQSNVEKTEKKPAADKPVCPVIEYLRVDEFEEVPKYMKGRHAYSRVNSMVDSLNKSLKAKYKILRMKMSSLNDVNRKRFRDFKQQETNDTKGLYFVVEGDLKEFAGVKMDAADRAMLTVLRHTQRIREIREAGVTRYTVIEPY